MAALITELVQELGCPENYFPAEAMEELVEIQRDLQCQRLDTDEALDAASRIPLVSVDLTDHGRRVLAGWLAGTRK